MKPPTLLESASGIRPTSAFVLIALALCGIGLYVGRHALAGPTSREPRREEDPAPEFSIVDARDRPLAQFVQRLDLVISPNALWQAHTPERLIAELVRVFGDRYSSDELHRRLMPDARDGVVRCAEPLNTVQALAVDRWTRQGSFDPDDPPRAVAGLWLERIGADAWTLCWRPALTLSAEMRALHVPRDDKNPLRWSRRLADAIARCLDPDAAVADGGLERELEAQRERIWRRLMPTTYAIALRGFDPSSAPRLFQLLTDEGVLHVQMHIARERDRLYPMGAFRLLGQWGYVDRAEAQARASRELGLAPLAADANAERVYTEPQARAWREKRGEILARVHPVSGLELACARELDDPVWTKLLERDPATYVFERHTPVRRKEPRIVPRTYYLDSDVGSETPRVVTTLDALLQRRVGEELDVLMERNKPAVAMAIVVDVETGDVLAVDSREAYPFAAFAPIKHQFTPGSTYKVIVMASALDQGVVEPSDSFDVGRGEYHLPGRVIREADNPGKLGVLTASEILAHSLNAGMVQIGPKVPADVLRAYLLGLGYGSAPRARLGPESAGYLAPLPWKANWTHASVSFGHELMVTLWQHAAGLATVVRGGTYVPLRLVDAVEQNGKRYGLPREVGHDVFRPETCALVRDMMVLGAREGTGKPVAGLDKLPEIEVGTKTGTAQKVATEVCLHVELAHQERHHRERSRCTKDCRKALVGADRVHRSCYTSSMCAWGRLPGDDRTIMVLVVADEPRTGKYGSRVAGPTAIAILKEALGVTRLGAAPLAEVVPGFAPSTVAPASVPDHPWAEVAR